MESMLKYSSPKNSKHEKPGITIIAEPIDVIGDLRGHVNMSANVLTQNPKYQWYDKHGAPMPRMCQSNLTIGPIKEEDFGFYRLEIRDEETNQIALTRWVELKRAPPRILTGPIHYYPQHQPQKEIYTEFQPIFPNSVEYLRQTYTDIQPQQKVYSQTEQLEPRLVKAPEGGEYRKGSRITLTAHFENATQYQWSKDGIKLEGCTWDTLIINNANLENTGYYDLNVSNGPNFSSVRTRVVIS